MDRDDETKEALSPREDAPSLIGDTASKDERSLRNCNFIKTLLMISVVLAHATLWWGGEWFTSVACPEVLAVLPQIGSYLCSFNIYCFALISGYLFYHLKIERNAYQGYGSFLWKKVKRLMIPYFFITTVWIMPISFFFHHYDFKTILLYYYLGTGGEQLWFLLMLFWVFLFFYPLAHFSDKHPIYGGMIALLFYGVGLIGGHFLPNVYQVFTGCDYAIFFYLGFLLRKYGFSKLNKVPSLVWVAVQIGMYVGVYFFSRSGFEGFIFKALNIGLNFILHIFGALSFFLVLQKLGSRIRWDNKVMRFIGERSMVVYELHQQIVFFCIYFLNGLIPPYVHALINFLIAFSLSLGIASLLLLWNPTRFLVGEKWRKKVPLKDGDGPRAAA